MSGSIYAYPSAITREVSPSTTRERASERRRDAGGGDHVRTCLVRGYNTSYLRTKVRKYFRTKVLSYFVLSTLYVYNALLTLYVYCTCTFVQTTSPTVLRKYESTSRHTTGYAQLVWHGARTVPHNAGSETRHLRPFFPFFLLPVVEPPRSPPPRPPPPAPPAT